MPTGYFQPSMPKGLEGLIDLALDLRWSWNHAADELWHNIDPDLWDKTGNPWLILQTIAPERLNELAADENLQELAKSSIAEYRETLKTKTWFQQAYPGKSFGIAYFSMEYGLS
jgi:starch phosphorylase